MNIKKHKNSGLSKANVRVMIVDDDPLVRYVLKKILRNRKDMEIVAEAGSGLEVLKLAREHKPDLVIMDINMPGLNGIVATRQLKESNLNPKVLALSVYSDQAMIRKMLEAGASGFLVKDSVSSEIADAMNAVTDGRTYLCSEAAEAMVKGNDDASPIAALCRELGLSLKEIEVLRLVAEGLPTKAIAVRLCIAEKTVEKYRSSTMKRLDIHSVAGLTKYAIRKGLTSV